jgi:4'-phosphopantetheinyl transferase EntD
VPLDVEDLLPADVRVAACEVRDRMADLVGAEPAPVLAAAGPRQAEYSTGRVLARRLLHEAGAPLQPLLRRPGGRLPAWPDGFVGSISHSGGICLAAVGSVDTYRGIGIDLEPDAPTRREIDRVVLCGSERDWVAAAGEEKDERSRRARLVFSAKEAVYKAFYPALRQAWRFRDVELEIDLEAARFCAALPEGAGLARVEGRILRRSGWILCGVAWPDAGRLP